MAAASQVLSTTELLEEILLRTRPKDVLLLQRICKSWKNAIEGSMKLQRMLFFLPIEPVQDNPKPGKSISAAGVRRIDAESTA
jgi:hypothetical protein